MYWGGKTDIVYNDDWVKNVYKIYAVCSPPELGKEFWSIRQLTPEGLGKKIRRKLKTLKDGTRKLGSYSYLKDQMPISPSYKGHTFLKKAYDVLNA